MDEDSLAGLFSSLIPDELAKNLGLTPEEGGGSKEQLAGLLKAAAGQAGGPLEEAIDEFLQGRGSLFKDTSSALSRGIGITETKIVSILTSKFNLPPAMAKLLAPLLIKLLPEVMKEAESTAKKKPRRKAKPKTTSSSTAKKKKKTTKKTTKKTSSSTKKTASSTSKKKPTSSSKKKAKRKTTRSSSLADSAGTE